jgi:hypothetical protein
VNSNERLVVHVGEKSHGVLAVHTVGHSSVAGDKITEVLDLESTLQSGGEEPTEGSDKRCEGSHGQDVELHGLDLEGGPKEGLERNGHSVGLLQEDRVGSALKSGPNICTEVLQFIELVTVQNIAQLQIEDLNAKSESGMLLKVQALGSLTSIKIH